MKNDTAGTGTARPTTACGDPWPCVCDVCALTIGLEHKLADRRCGRVWVCSCASCERSRKLLADWQALPPERRAAIRLLEAARNVIRELEPAIRTAEGKRR